MKYFVYFLALAAFGLITFNATQLNFDAMFSSDNKVIFITILAGLCVIVLSAIWLISKKIEEKDNNK